MHLSYLFAVTAISLLSSVVVSQKCGYVRGPFATTNDTLVIKLDCEESTPKSQYFPLQVPKNTTHVAIQLFHCHTVPVDLFSDVTNHVTSVTVASEDAIQLLNGTFEGLQMVSELRLIGFTKLKNIGLLLLEPMRNIQILILDGFGKNNIKLSYLGSVIRKLSGTPIRRLVLNGIKDTLFINQPIMKVDVFKISNASVKELIITETPFNYEGTIRLAFPNLTCFYAEKGNTHSFETLLPVWDMMLLSDELKEIVIYRPNDLPAVQHGKDLFNIPLKEMIPAAMKIGHIYPDLYSDLINYILTRSVANVAVDCEFGFTLKIGANLLNITANGVTLFTEAKKSVCVQEDNNLVYLDLTSSQLPRTATVIKGLRKLEYLSLDNTGIKRLPNSFLHNYPSLKVLKAGKVDIGNFITNISGNFFGSCPTLEGIFLVDDNLTKIPTMTFSQLLNLQHLDLSKNSLRTFDLDLQNCTKLNILNLSHNNIESISQKRISQLTQIASVKSGASHMYLVVDLSFNRLRCLCNSTHFIKWLQQPVAETNVMFSNFDGYTCLYPNGTTVRASEVTVSEVEQQCSAIQTLVNGTNCPCDEDQRRRLEQVWVHLEGFLCKNDAGDLVAIKNRPLPSCFNPYTRASFIAPVAVGGILAVAVSIAVGLLIYHRNTRHVRQVRECLEMNPPRFIRIALQYMMMHNREEEHAEFRYDMIIFVQDDDRSAVHNHFIEALQGKRCFITRDDFVAGVPVVEAMAQCIRDCKWIVLVLTAQFLSDPVCTNFVNRVQFERPHALIPIIWEKPLEPIDMSIDQLLRTGNPLCWPEYKDKGDFWSSLLDRSRPTQL